MGACAPSSGTAGLVVVACLDSPGRKWQQPWPPSRTLLGWLLLLPLAWGWGWKERGGTSTCTCRASVSAASGFLVSQIGSLCCSLDSNNSGTSFPLHGPHVCGVTPTNHLSLRNTSSFICLASETHKQNSKEIRSHSLSQTNVRLNRLGHIK